MLLWAIVFGINIAISITKVPPFFAGGQLSDEGAYFAIFAHMGIIGICGTARAAYDLIENRKAKE